MGYYNGNGVTSGGGSTVTPHESFWLGGSLNNTFQRIDSVVTMKAGVKLDTAQSEKGECSLTSRRWSVGSGWYTSLNCKGTKKTVSYSQINGSNLYALNVTSDTVMIKLNNGNWES